MPYFAGPVADGRYALLTFLGWVVAGIAGQPLPGLWPIEDWPADFQLTEQETLDGVLAYYAETAGPASCWKPTKPDKWQ